MDSLPPQQPDQGRSPAVVAASRLGKRGLGNAPQGITIPTSTRPKLTHEIVENITLIARHPFSVAPRNSWIITCFFPGRLDNDVQAFKGKE